MNIRNEGLAYNIINNSISLNEGDNLLVKAIGEEGLELAKEIIRQSKKMNAKATLNIIKKGFYYFAPISYCTKL